MIFIAGPHNAGKTTIARELLKYGFLHVETGDIIREHYKEISPHTDFTQWAKEMNNHHPSHFNDLIADFIEKIVMMGGGAPSIYGQIIVTGNRQLDGIRYIQARIKGKQWFIRKLATAVELSI